MEREMLCWMNENFLSSRSPACDSDCVHVYLVDACQKKEIDKMNTTILTTLRPPIVISLYSHWFSSCPLNPIYDDQQIRFYDTFVV